MSNTITYTPQQAAIINASPDSDYRVIAVAGSGKTSVCVKFATNLIQIHKIPAEQVLMVTFSVNATNEIKQRMEKHLGKNSPVAGISTLHSLCLSICRDSHSVYNTRRVENWSDWKTKAAIRTCLDSKVNRGGKVKRNEKPYLEALLFGLYKQSKKYAIGDWLRTYQQTFDPKNRQEYHPYLTPRLVEFVFERVEEAKEQANGLDFDDMPQYALETLNSRPALKAIWSEKYRYIIVDEFQDTDHCQYQVVLNLLGKSTRIMVVGDQSQCLYEGFRYTDPNLLAKNILVDRKGMKDFPLTHNFRSGRKILDVANRALKANKYGKNSHLVHFEPNGEGQVVHREIDADVVYEIQKLQQNGIAYDSCAVLNRYNHESVALELDCMTREIPYIMHGAYSIHDNRAVSTILAYLEVMYSTNVDASNKAFRVIANAPNRYISNKILDSLEQKAAKKNISVINFIKSDRSPTDDWTCGKLKDLANGVSEVVRQCQREKMDDTINFIIQQFELADWMDTLWEEEGKISANAQACIDKFKLFSHKFKSYQELMDSLKNLKKLKKPVGSLDAINILTGHKAKGLEFDIVFLKAGYGLFPKKDISDADDEAERRLFYVMVTRARKVLFLYGNSEYIKTAVAGLQVDKEINIPLLKTRLTPTLQPAPVSSVTIPEIVQIITTSNDVMDI